MIGVCVTSKGNFRLRELPEPQLTDENDVKIQVAYAGLCGDDVHVLRGDLGSFQDSQIMGDEMSGIVVDLGKNAYGAGFRVGDRVSGISRRSCGKCIYCLSGRPHGCKSAEPQGVMCEYVVLKYTQLCRLPAGMDLKTGELLSLVSVCAECIEQADIQWGSSVAIFGAGGIGLIVLQLAARRGAGEITVVEPVETKRELAKHLGATHVIDPLAENVFARAYHYTGNLGYDSVIEASGSTDGFNNAISIVANLGVLVTPSIYHSDFKYSLDMMDFLWRQISLRSVRTGSMLKLPQVVTYMEQLDLSELTANVFPLRSISEAYDAFTSGLYPKVLLKVH